MFMNKNQKRCHIGSFDNSLDDQHRSLFFLRVRRFQQCFEFLYNINVEMIHNNINLRGLYFTPFLFILFFFILLCNLIGMIPYSFTITSHLIITFTLSLTVYIGLNLIGIQKHKKNFLTLFLPSGSNIFLIPLLVPIEFISYLSRVISLPVRLFANMMSGHILLKVIAGFAWSMLNINFLLFLSHLLPLILLIILTGLEFGVACIQAYVFSNLVSLYINDALNLH